MSQTVDNSGDIPRPIEQMPNEIIQHQCDNIFGTVQELLDILDYDPDEHYNVDAAIYSIEDEDGVFSFVSSADSDATMSFSVGDKVTVMSVGVDSSGEVTDDDLYYVRLADPITVTSDHLDSSSFRKQDELVPRTGWERFSDDVAKSKTLLVSQEVIEGTYDKETIIRTVVDGKTEILFDGDSALVSLSVLGSIAERLQAMVDDEKQGMETAQIRATLVILGSSAIDVQHINEVPNVPYDPRMVNKFAEIAALRKRLSNR